MKFIPHISFPVLGKELLEQANRKRTYIVRVTFTLLMGMVFLIVISQSMSSGSGLDLWSLRYIGKNIMNTVVVCQFVAVLIILPSSMAAVVTLEKERNSLELIMLTRLRPWEIILQKYFSRIIPIMMFIFLSLPLMAIAYSMGGFEMEFLSYLFSELIVLIFFIGAIGILCSTFFRSSVSSIIMTYISVGAFIGIASILPRYFSNSWNSFESYIVFWMVIQAVFTVFALIFSIRFLLTRRYHRKGNPVLRIFNALDKFWKNINSITGGIEIIKSDNYQLPLFNPIRWYEKYKRPAGRLHYLVRIVILLTLPVIFLFLLNAYDMRNLNEISQIIMFFLLGITVICLMSKGASIVAADRQNQTLSVLLTTSVSSKQLILERMKGIGKLKIAMGIPIMLLMVLIILFGNDNSYRYYYRNGQFSFYYALTTIVFFFVHLNFILWFCCWLGLKLKTNRQAIMASFIFMVLWIIVPFIPVFMANVIFDYNYDMNEFCKSIAYFSPITAFGLIFGSTEFYIAPFIIFSFFILVLYIYFRIRVLLKADKYLRK